MKSVGMMLAILLGAISVGAQNNYNQQSTILAWSPAKNLGMFVYPMYNQTPYQNLSDQNDCYRSAMQQTGFDPQAPPPPPPNPQQQQAAQQQAAQQAANQARKGQTLWGAAIGGGGGAAIGAIAGNAGEGAAIGAIAGGILGRIRHRREKEEAAKEAAQQESAAQQSSQAQTMDQWQGGLNSFKRAFTACLGARGYSAD